MKQGVKFPVLHTTLLKGARKADVHASFDQRCANLNVFCNGRLSSWHLDDSGDVRSAGEIELKGDEAKVTATHNSLSARWFLTLNGSNAAPTIRHTNGGAIKNRLYTVSRRGRDKTGPITAACADPYRDVVFTGGSMGELCSWDVNDEARHIYNDKNTRANKVVGMCAEPGGRFVITVHAATDYGDAEVVATRAGYLYQKFDKDEAGYAFDIAGGPQYNCEHVAMVGDTVVFANRKGDVHSIVLNANEYIISAGITLVNHVPKRNVPATAINASLGGRYFVVGFADGLVQIFDTKDLQNEQQSALHVVRETRMQTGLPVIQVAFSGNEKRIYIVSLTDDGNVGLFVWYFH